MTNFRVIFILFLVQFGSSIVFAQAEPTPWMLVEAGATFQLPDREVRTPTDGFAAWSTARMSSPLGRDPLSDANIRMVERVRWLVALKADGLLGWERALNAASYSEAEENLAVVIRWDNTLLSAEDGSFIQRILVAALYNYGSAVAVLPSVCLPEQAGEIRMLEEVIFSEISIPAYRVRASIEERRRLPSVEELSEALESEWGPVFYSALVAASSANVSLSDEYEALLRSDMPFSAECDPFVVQTLSELPNISREVWSEERDWIQLIYETRLVPKEVTIRIAIGQYFRANLDAIALLDSYSTPQYGANQTMWLQGLHLGITDPENAPQLPDTEDPFIMWARAEVNRQQENYNTTNLWAQRALNRDSFFVAAILSRSSAFILRHQGADAMPDLIHLRRIGGHVPLYVDWQIRLSRAASER